MNKIIINNDYSYLESYDEILLNKLWVLLRERDKNYWHSPAYQSGRWDGFVNFFDKKSGKFLTGLLPEVVLALKTFNKNYTIVDNREKFQWLHQDIGQTFLNQWTDKSIEMYDYQPDLVNQVIKYGRGIIKVPTAGGKTYVAISILKCLPPKTPVLFLTKNAGLVNQNYKEMQKWGVENLGRWYGKYKEANFIMCCTTHFETLKSIEKLLPKFKVLIVDEVHECMSAVPIKAYKKMKAARIRVGISATPFKDGGKDKCQKMEVKGYFGGVLKTKTTQSGLITTQELQERNILSKSKCIFYPIDHPQIPYEPYIDAITLGIAENFHFLDIIKRLALSLNGRTLILVERIDQGNLLSNLLPHAHWISGKDKLDIKQSVFDELCQKPKVTAICTRHIITAGINVFLHDLINAAGGLAEHSIIQKMGRGLRRADDKELLHYHDFMFNINKHLDKHSVERYDVLEKEGHEMILKERIDF